MNPLTWVLVGILVYWVAAEAVKRRGLLPAYVSVSGPLLTLHTQRGKALLDRLAQRKRLWRAWANIGIGISLVVMVAAFGFLLLSALLAVTNPQQAGVSQPRNVLVIPGVNDFLPLEVAPEIVLGLIVGLVVHEGGHGLLCRVEDIEIESMGVALFTLIPLGAFVEPEAESQTKTNRGGRTRMFAAGVTNNFAITIVVFALLFGPIAGSIAVAPGAAVGTAIDGGAASDADIADGDRITAVDGQPIETNGDLSAYLENTSETEHTVEVNEDAETTVERTVLVTGAPQDGVVDVSIGDRIRAVDGTEVRSETQLRDALAASEVVTAEIEREDGEDVERTFPAGTSVLPQEDGALAAAGAPVGEEQIIVRVDGERVLDNQDLSDEINARSPGDELSLVAYNDGEQRTYNATLGGDPGDPRLGVLLSPGYSGVTVDDFGIQPYPAGGFLEMIGGDAGEHDSLISDSITDSFIGKSIFSIMLPIASLVFGEEMPFNFAGFTSDVTNFYTIEGPFALFGGGVFVLANILFWIGWININLGFFNCIPAFPLDGGHILRSSTESVTTRLPVDATYGLTKAITITVGLTMLASFLLLIFGQGLLA